MGPEPPSEPNGRKYRSKKQRPCDLCRSRKVHCKILGNEVACETCRKLNRRCTFVLEPLRRTYQPRDAGDKTNHPPTNPVLSERDQDGATLGRLPSLDDAGPSAEPMEEAASLWNPTADREQSFRPRTSSHPIPMDWSAMDFSLGTPFLYSGVQEVSADGAPYPMPDQDTHRHTGFQSEGRDECMPDVLLHTENTMCQTSPRTTGAFATFSESPSSALDPEGSANGRIMASATEAGSESSPQQSTDTASVNDFRRRGSHASDWPDEFSLDSRKGYSNQLIGLSCESDPYLLRHYRYDKYDTYPMFRLDFRMVMDDEKMQSFEGNVATDPPRPPAGYLPVQFVMTHEDIWKDSLKAAEGVLAGPNTETGDFELLNKLVPPDVGSRLLRLYSLFVHSRFPVLSAADLEKMPYSGCDSLRPVGLQSAVYAMAAPFTFLDDELSVLRGYGQVPTEDLWAIARRSYQRATCFSHLASLQLCLLLLQTPPPNFAVAEPLSTWALSCSALSIAESLGLNLEPSEWRLPRKEVMLRRRLWWLTYSDHIWQALVIGRPSHLNDANWDVSKLTADDFEVDELQDAEVRATVSRQIPLCLAQCELSIIAGDVLKEFYTLRAIRESPSLNVLLNRAQPLRTRIEGWRQTIPLLSKLASELNEEEFEDGAALRMSHLTLETLIFRALLRPLVSQDVTAAENTREPISTIFENCYTCAKVGTDIVSALRAKHIASFWHPYVRYQLSYFSSFILMNLAQSPTKESAIRNKVLLGRWRDTLRTQSRAWPLARLATIRLDAVFWKGLSSAVHRAGPDSPAALLIRKQTSNGTGDG